MTGTERTVWGKSRSEIDGSGPAEGKRSLGAHRRVVKYIVPQLILFGESDGCCTPFGCPIAVLAERDVEMRPLFRSKTGLKSVMEVERKPN